MKLCLHIFLLAVVGLASSRISQAQSCAPDTLQSKVIYEQRPVTTYRLEYETVFEDREIVVRRPVWETQTRERRYTVRKPVTEKSFREERYTVRRPVTETSFRTETYNVVTYVEETAEREERSVVIKPVWETKTREISQTVQRPITETVIQERMHTVYDPVTTYQNQVVDQGSYVDTPVLTPGRARTGLQWLRGQWVADPSTGATYWQRAGFYWTNKQTPGVYQVQRQYVPNYVTQQVAQTNYQPRTVVEKVPTQVTRMVSETSTRQEPYQVLRYEQHEEVRKIPYTVRRPVTKQVTRKIPVKTLKYVEHEEVRKIPVTTTHYEYEERVEQIPVKVYRIQTERQVVRRPRTVAKWVPHTEMRTYARRVTMRVPIGGVSHREATPIRSAYYGEATPIIEPARRTVTRKAVIEEEPAALPNADAPSPSDRQPAAEGQPAGDKQSTPPKAAALAPVPKTPILQLTPAGAGGGGNREA